jgi:fimbrial isopeptide formation D2 family protein/LPXTG-motif cell wall-anchored protein
MKRMKNIFAVFFAVIMVLSMVTAVSAQEQAANKGSITIDNAVPGQTYTIYRIFDLESYDGEKYAYTVNDKWKTFAEGATDYVTLSDDKYVTWKENADAEEFAKEAQLYAEKYTVAAEASKAASELTNAQTAAGQQTTTVEFEGLDLGYYLVDSTMGTLCGLNTTAKDVTIKEKNAAPTLVKKVQEGESWTDSNDATIGDTVEFQTTIHAQKGAQNYVLHDKMSEGLTFGGIKSVTLNGEEVTNDNSISNYSLSTTNPDDKCTFEIAFTPAFCDTLSADSKIVVSYTAKLNKNAVIAGAGNTNEARMTYGETTRETTWNKTTTYTWSVDVFKYTNANTPLAGVTFTLSTDKDGANVIKFSKKTSVTEKKDDESAANATPSADIYVVDSSGDANITTNDSGKFELTGLDAGTYYLKETVAPAGYNMLSAPVEIVIESTEGTTSGTLTESIKVGDETVTEVDVQNNSGAVLPSTGGIGTTVFTVTGLILMAGAAVLIVTRRRMNTRK